MGIEVLEDWIGPKGGIDGNKIQTVGIENSKSLGMVAPPPPAIVTEIVAEMITLDSGNVRE